MNYEKQNRNIKSLHLSPRNHNINQYNKSLAGFKYHQKIGSMNVLTLINKSSEERPTPILMKKQDKNQFIRKERATDQNRRNQFSFWRKKNSQEDHNSNPAHKKLEHCFLQLLQNVRNMKGQTCMNQTQTKLNQKHCPKQIIKVKVKNQSQYKKNVFKTDAFLYSKDNFTLPLKQVRKKHRKQNNNDSMNCRVINIFESIEEDIKPIHQTDTMGGLMKNALIKESLVKQNLNLQKNTIGSKQKENIEIPVKENKSKEEKVQWYITKMNLTEHKNIKKNNKKTYCELFDQEIQLPAMPKEKKQKGTAKYGRERKQSNLNQQQIELKPWSTQYIHTEC